MNRLMFALAGIIIFCLAAAGCALFDSRSVQEAARISAPQLKGMLDHSDVVVVDVRSMNDWNNSESKIKGAVREDLSAISSWINKYPKGKTLVFYCA